MVYNFKYNLTEICLKYKHKFLLFLKKKITIFKFFPPQDTQYFLSGELASLGSII